MTFESKLPYYGLGFCLNLHQQNEELPNENEQPNGNGWPNGDCQMNPPPKTTAHQAQPAKDPVLNETPPHSPHGHTNPPSIPLPPDSNPMNNDLRMTSCQMRPPHMMKTTPNEDMKQHNAKNHTSHTHQSRCGNFLRYSSDPTAHTYLQPIPSPCEHDPPSTNLLTKTHNPTEYKQQPPIEYQGREWG
ncbi:hypothetical protein BS47DRAFT_1363714 [Hydnum rufescens UP504]|uniref:Uncharacterized protein n=1 Tax=Hydnum rufescens UP504 TaxID=1448309 RepID=A0A9P6DQX4_9AGAM|nr:hypothetical protein BS47DRAFT_1363714 [Hydnum rufescens UP504]